MLGIILLFSSCCSWDYDNKDFEFSDKELNLLRVYKINDTIYFQSNLGNIDTITVLKISEKKRNGSRCFISLPPSHDFDIVIMHLPFDRWTGINQDEGGEKEITYQYLISVSKKPLDKETYYLIEFKDFFALGQSIFSEFKKECIVGGKTLYDCYKIKHSYPERIENQDDIEFLYWTTKYGLTAYSSKSGETWFLIK